MQLKLRISKQTLLKMKLTCVLMIVFGLHLSARTHSQEVTISVKNAPFEKVLNLVKAQTGFSFFADVHLLSSARPVSLNLKKVPLKDALEIIFKDQSFTYSLDGKIITITAPTQGLNPGLGKPGFSPAFLSPPVTGIITDADGQPLAGVNVVIKGTKRGVITDANGKFSIDAGINETLLISSIGYNAIELKIRDRRIPVILSLQKSISQLDEVQIIAYGTTNKKFSTSNIGSVSGEEIARQPVSNPLLALQGRVPGLFIQQNTGQTIGQVGIIVQGLNSARSGTSPFFVIDGIPYSPEFTNSTILGGNNLGNRPIGNIPGGGSGGSTFNFINPADIESVTILKDADATAIYGSRAANGAILITTKKGKAGKTKVDINAQSGWGKVTKKPKYLNTDQYLEMRKEAYANSNQPVPNSNTTPSSSNFDLTIWDQNKNHDWWDELVGGTANYSTVNASVSGGTDRATFLVGSGYSKHTTVFPNDLADKKYNVNLSVNTTSENKKFNFSAKGIFLQDNNRLNGVDLSSRVGKIAPNAPDLYNPDGSLNWGPYPTDPTRYSFENPLQYLYQEYHSITNNLMGSALISYEIFPGLMIKSSFGYNMLFGDEMILNKSKSFNPTFVGNPSNSSFQDRNINTYIIEPQITYTKKYKFGTIDFLLGSTFQETSTKYGRINAKGFNNDNQLSNLSAATTVTPGASSETLYKYDAIFARLNYRVADKYIVNLTTRRDGSSRFGDNNKLHNFYSLGGAWLFGDEYFVKELIPVLSMGKFRLNYGTTGNDQINDYQYESLLGNVYAEIPFQGIVGLAPIGLSNPFLQWEKTAKLNAGLDLAFLDNKISFSADYFRNRSSNQLIDFVLPGITGFTTVKSNFDANIQNTGVELLVNVAPLRKSKITWSFSFNATIAKNKLIAFPGLAESPYASTFIIGQPVNIIQAYKFGGVNPQTGLYQFETSKGEMVASPNFRTDKTQLININPKWYGSFSNTLSYKGFELDFLITYVNQVAPNIKYDNNNAGIININLPPYVLERWQSEGDNSNVQKYLNSTYVNIVSASDAKYSDGSFFRLKNLSFAYSFPSSLARRIGFSGLRTYLQGQNLLTVTKYEGADPETHSLNYLPPLKMFTVGLQVSL